MLAALLLLMRTRRDRWLPLAFATAGVMVVAGYVLLRMLEGDVESLFFGGRLRDPLGYVNGQAGYFLLGFWPCVALAEQTRSRVLAGLGAGCAVVLGALLVLSQTRGVLPAVAASGLVVLLFVPGRPRRVFALAAIGLGLAAISGPLLDVYRELPEGQPADPQLVKDAARLVLLAAALVGLGWAVVQAVLERLGRGAGIGGVVRRGEAVLAAGAVVLALAAAVAVVGDPVDKVRQQYDDFVNLRTDSPGDTRFLSGGGYRYDYWSVAWLEFEREPLRGEGAGNYDRVYFAERKTTEDIRQPHSLPLQTLAELGLVGGLLLLAFVGAVLAGFWRQSRLGRQSRTRRTLAVAAGGAFVAWLAHTSVDWLHNIPGVTGIAICAAAALVAPWTRHARGSLVTSSRIVAVALVAVVAVAAADSVGTAGTGGPGSDRGPRHPPQRPRRGAPALERVTRAERRLGFGPVREERRVRPAGALPGGPLGARGGDRARAERPPHLGAAWRSRGTPRKVPCSASKLPPLAGAQPPQPVRAGSGQGPAERRPRHPVAETCELASTVFASPPNSD